MRRKLIRFGLIAAAVVIGPRIVHAESLEADLREKSVVLHATFTFAANTSSNIVLVSLSSSTVWPNPTIQTGYINVNNIFVTIDKLATTTETVKIGVVTYVDTSTGSVKYFFDANSLKNVSNTNANIFYESDNSFRCLKVIPGVTGSGLDGTTPFLMSNDILEASNLINSTTTLSSVNILNSGMGGAGGGKGSIFPGVGDIILSVLNNDSSNAIGITVDMVYHYASR